MTPLQWHCWAFGFLGEQIILKVKLIPLSHSSRHENFPVKSFSFMSYSFFLQTFESSCLMEAKPLGGWNPDDQIEGTCGDQENPTL